MSGSRHVLCTCFLAEVVEKDITPLVDHIASYSTCQSGLYESQADTRGYTTPYQNESSHSTDCDTLDTFTRAHKASTTVHTYCIRHKCSCLQSSKGGTWTSRVSPCSSMSMRSCDSGSTSRKQQVHILLRHLGQGSAPLARSFGKRQSGEVLKDKFWPLA